MSEPADTARSSEPAGTARSSLTTPVSEARRWRERENQPAQRGGGVRLTILGCAGSFPGPEAACSAYLLEAGDFRLLIDLDRKSVV